MRVDVALMLGAAVVVVTVSGAAIAGVVVEVVVDLVAASVREVDVTVEVEPRVSLPCAA